MFSSKATKKSKRPSTSKGTMKTTGSKLRTQSGLQNTIEAFAKNVLVDSMPIKAKMSRSHKISRLKIKRHQPQSFSGGCTLYKFDRTRHDFVVYEHHNIQDAIKHLAEGDYIFQGGKYFIKIFKRENKRMNLDKPFFVEAITKPYFINFRQVIPENETETLDEVLMIQDMHFSSNTTTDLVSSVASSAVTRAADRIILGEAARIGIEQNPISAYDGKIQFSSEPIRGVYQYTHRILTSNPENYIGRDGQPLKKNFIEIGQAKGKTVEFYSVYVVYELARADDRDDTIAEAASMMHWLGHTNYRLENKPGEVKKYIHDTDRQKTEDFDWATTYGYTALNINAFIGYAREVCRLFSELETIKYAAVYCQSKQHTLNLRTPTGGLNRQYGEVIELVNYCVEVMSDPIGKATLPRPAHYYRAMQSIAPDHYYIALKIHQFLAMRQQPGITEYTIGQVFDTLFDIYTHQNLGERDNHLLALILHHSNYPVDPRDLGEVQVHGLPHNLFLPLSYQRNAKLSSTPLIPESVPVGDYAAVDENVVKQTHGILVSESLDFDHNTLMNHINRLVADNYLIMDEMKKKPVPKLNLIYNNTEGKLTSGVTAYRPSVYCIRAPNNDLIPCMSYTQTWTVNGITYARDHISGYFYEPDTLDMFDFDKDGEDDVSMVFIDIKFDENYSHFPACMNYRASKNYTKDYYGLYATGIVSYEYH